MMKHSRKFNLLKKQSSFTLIEIIVVLVILGVLASIALPLYFLTIEHSRTAEVVPVLKDLATQLEVCGFKQGTLNGCVVSSTTTHFSPISSTVYIFGASEGYTVTAARNNVDNTNPQSNPPVQRCFINGNIVGLSANGSYGGFVGICYDAATGKRTTVGGGIYSGMF